MTDGLTESLLERFRLRDSYASMKLSAADTIARLELALAPDFVLVPLEAPDAPLFLAVAVPLSEGVTGRKPRLPAGRGMTPQQAMIAAGAEALELRASLAQRHLHELSTLPRPDRLAVARATDLLSGAEIPVLAQSVYLDCATVLDEPLTQDADSTGCAVGPTREAALTAAVWECVERDALALWWHGNRPATRLALEVIDAHQPRLFWWLHQRERQTVLLDLTTDIGLPVVVAVSCDADGGGVALGAAARPVVAQAALAAVTEMVQTEVSLELACAAGDAESLAWAEIGSTRRQAQFAAQGDSVTADASPGLRPLLTRLEGLGHRVLGVDLTLPEDPMPSVRAIIPGLCAMRGRIDTPRFARACPGVSGPNLPEPF